MLALKIAARFLWAAKLQTILIALGIGIGVSVQVFIGSLIDGLQADLIDSTIGSQPHITISAEKRGDLITDDEAIKSEIEAFDENILVVSKNLDGPGNIMNDETDPIVIKGVEFEDANVIYGFDKNLLEGNLPTDDGVLIGKDLADMLELSIGDTFEIAFAQVGFKVESVEIKGIFDLGVSSLNSTWVVVDLSYAKTILETDKIAAYELQIDDVFASDSLSESLQAQFGGFTIREWQSENQELLSGLEGQSISSLMIQIFVIISVVLGISSVLAITVLQKSQQIGILKAMGITDKKASLIFLAQGLILGIIGAFIGVSFGLFLTISFTTFAVDANGEPIVNLLINPWFVVFSALIAITASIIASLLPARNSARLSIIEVIRNG